MEWFSGHLRHNVSHKNDELYIALLNERQNDQFWCIVTMDELQCIVTMDGWQLAPDKFLHYLVKSTQLLTDKTRSYIVFFGAPKRFSANKYLEQLLKSSSNGSFGYILFQMSYPNVSTLPLEIPWTEDNMFLLSRILALNRVVYLKINNKNNSLTPLEKN